MNLRVSADQAGWSIREAAWDFEERVLWRGSDATRDALERAAHATSPLQRLIQTKLTWPLADAYRARGRKTRAALAGVAAAAALTAGVAGAIKATDHGSTTHQAVSPLAPVAATPQASSNSLVLKGVTPQFQAGDAPAPPAPAPKPTEKPAQVAWDFAQAFVTYEVGRSSKTTEAAFADTATKQLAKTLKSDPPRLPSSGKVPKARVLNVVLGTASKQQVIASVSMVRLRAMSELRLTLTRDGGERRVAQVLG
jgi:hypothetical protein